MQTIPRQAESEAVGKNDNRKRPEVTLTRGMIILGVLVFIVGLGLVAHYGVNEHSASIKFFTEAFFSFMVLIVIIVQATIYYQQSKIMERSTNLASHALYVSERPYVVVYDIQVTNLPFEPDKRIVYGATTENKGKTPAYNVEFRMYIDVEPYLLPEEPDYRGVRTRDSRMTLGMNTPATAKQTDINDILTQEQVAKIADDKLFVYIWGIVRYREGFTNQTHYTKFYVIYDPEEKRCTAGGHHNDMT